jgi:NADPH-dependent 2,4-dienoyl-CoA reductase/sulfur reductase-like enzyme/nitrite reductase/ring-hydroxylating ferredoxin subunit
MSAGDGQPSGPDLAAGVEANSLADGQCLEGHVGTDAVVLARSGEEMFALGAKCTHYGGPLAEGLAVGDTIRCPWHHACFSLRTGEALRGPALNPVDRWTVELRGSKVHVTGKGPAAPPRKRPSVGPRRVVIVGGGAAGNAAAEMLRNEGFEGSITLLSADTSVPYDRPNLSKDYLAGTAPEEWIPLRSPEYYTERGIELRLGTRVAAIAPARHEVSLENGTAIPYDALLLATGASPVRLAIPGADLPHVFTLRTLADSRAIIARAREGSRAVVFGASFIGLEVAAALRNRGVEVQVVAPDAVPMERVLGGELGRFVKALHEKHGVVFHLGRTPQAIDSSGVTLSDGSRIAADLVVMGVGVRPVVDLAQAAGLEVDHGVLVDSHLRSSAPDVFVAGDAASWKDARTGERIRVEHWVVAERQGQSVARTLLGGTEPFDDVPFFWSVHYDATFNYVGHAERWETLKMEGRPEARDCRVELAGRGRVLAVITLGRDRQSLEAEVALGRSERRAG